MSDSRALYKNLPSIDKVLQREEILPLIDEFGAAPVKEKARAMLAELRTQLAANSRSAIAKVSAESFLTEYCQHLAGSVRASAASSLVPVLNLTGTVIHTNLGRSRLPAEALEALRLAGGEATNLEYDLKQGKRGDRDSHVESILCEITGAEAITVVNNNAAAVLLALNTLAAGKEVLISRGELVEIGGSFRIPDVMRSAHSKLREVGTTNRTHLKDYADAITESTGLLLKVHTSNYEVQGFTATVTELELAELGREKGLPSMADLGSGTLIELAQYGLPAEPTVQTMLEAGVDIVTFSGDKLLGGPQAGIIAGRKDLIERIKNNPLKRALRVDKLTLAALEAVLTLYRDPERLKERLPLLSDLTRPADEISQFADSLLPVVRELMTGRADVQIVATHSQIGSGALPLDVIPSFALQLTPLAGKGESDRQLLQLAASLRELSRPVIGRIHDGKLLLDLRCLRDGELLLDLLAELSAGD